MDSYEFWLGSQTAAPGEAKHRNPPEDAYEAWVKKRVEASGREGTNGEKTTPRGSDEPQAAG